MRTGKGLDDVADEVPLEGGVKANGEGLGDLPASGAEKDRLVGGREVTTVAASETEDVGFPIDSFHRPLGVSRGPVAFLGDVLLVPLAHQVLVEVTPQPHRTAFAREKNSIASTDQFVDFELE